MHATELNLNTLSNVEKNKVTVAENSNSAIPIEIEVPLTYWQDLSAQTHEEVCCMPIRFPTQVVICFANDSVG